MDSLSILLNLVTPFLQMWLVRCLEERVVQCIYIAWWIVLLDWAMP